jgi:peroxiredoxin
MTKKIMMIAFPLLVFSIIANAQISNLSKDTLVEKKANILKDLKKAEHGDIDQSKQVVLNPLETPIFYEDLSKIKESDFTQIISSGNYIPEPYIDSNKVVKAFVLRKATEQEKKSIMQIQENMQKNNDLIGKEAFPFSITDIFGNNFSMGKLKGKVIVINFWFVECKPCIMEIPELNALVDKYKGKEVVFLGFSTNDKLKIEEFLKTKTFKYNIIPDSKEVAGLYNVNSFPTHFVVDKNSIISYYGLGSAAIKDIDMKIESLIK